MITLKEILLDDGASLNLITLTAIILWGTSSIIKAFKNKKL